ncbi:MAG: hypothetical protein ACLGHQ_12730, partial [Acidimicrobiia bacterium]
MNSLGRSLLLASLAVGLTGAPTTIVHAASDVSGSVRTIAERAAELVVEEHSLLQLSTASNLDPAERNEIEARIATVDARGAELLSQLDRLDVALSQAIRVGLGELAPLEERSLEPAVYVPSNDVYRAAADDLRRIAADPDSVTNAPSSSGSSSFALLAVAALALLALGAAALGNSLRRHPDPELEALAWSDGLTGLASRRRLDVDLAQHAGRDLPTSAIMVDVGRFDEIV